MPDYYQVFHIDGTVHAYACTANPSLTMQGTLKIYLYPTSGSGATLTVSIPYKMTFLPDTGTPGATATGTITLASGQRGTVLITGYSAGSESGVSRCNITGSGYSMHLSQISFVSGSAPCDKYAATTGSNSNTGTAGSPYQTPQKLVSSLSAGQTGCLNGGTYVQDVTIDNSKNGVTIQSTPDQRATWRGRIVLKGDDITLQNLNLDGRNLANGGTAPFPSPTIDGNRDALIGDDITSAGSANEVASQNICVELDNFYGNTPFHTVIDDNVIHNCGWRTAQDASTGGHLHGIYVVHSNHADIYNNVFYSNADRAIQLWPDAQNNVIEQNTMDRNGYGVDFGSAGSTASSNNYVAENIVTNSTAAWNVYTDWESGVGSNNAFGDSCLFQPSGSYTTDGGIGPDRRGVDYGLIFNATQEYTAFGNRVADPEYVNAAGRDYRVQYAYCRDLGANPWDN